MKISFTLTALCILVAGLVTAKTDAQMVGTVIVFNMWLLAAMTK